MHTAPRLATTEPGPPLETTFLGAAVASAEAVAESAAASGLPVMLEVPVLSLVVVPLAPVEADLEAEVEEGTADKVVAVAEASLLPAEPLEVLELLLLLDEEEPEDELPSPVTILML